MFDISMELSTKITKRLYHSSITVFLNKINTLLLINSQSKKLEIFQTVRKAS